MDKEKGVQQFRREGTRMQKYFPNLRPEEVIKLSRVLVSVGSTALRRAGGIEELQVGVGHEHEPT